MCDGQRWEPTKVVCDESVGIAVDKKAKCAVERIMMTIRAATGITLRWWLLQLWTCACGQYCGRNRVGMWWLLSEGEHDASDLNNVNNGLQSLPNSSSVKISETRSRRLCGTFSMYCTYLTIRSSKNASPHLTVGPSLRSRWPNALLKSLRGRRPPSNLAGA